jgi:hypothetical protein
MYDRQGIDIVELIYQAGFMNGYAIRDPETFTEQGVRTKKYFNVLFLKGKLSEEVFSNMDSYNFLHISEIILN